MPEKKPWSHVGHRVLGNPFVPSGTAYCLRCKEMGASKAEARYEGTVYAMKEWCEKCGHIIRYAVSDTTGYGMVPDVRKQQRARAWVRAPEADRSGGLVDAYGKKILYQV